MKLSAFSAGFHDYELDLEYYHGKDLLHQGCLLKIDKDYSWERISSKIRNKIRKAQQLDTKIERVKGTADDIEKFRSVWFDPKDPTIPDQLEEDEVMYLTYMEGKLVGGLILTPSSSSVLYMHNLGSNEAGKRLNIPALTLWHAVEDLQGSKWQYIDVGVSFRPTLYTFFKNWQADSYPVVFNPPFIAPDIRLTPFENRDVIAYKAENKEFDLELSKKHFGEQFTILPHYIYCIKAILKHLDIKKNENVAVYKTFDNDYISRCVSGPIESQCTLTRKIDDKTKAVIVIHEFGYPYTEIKNLKQECEEQGIPLIEDCAWSMSTFVDDETKIGDIGDYAIFSLPKIFPMQFGAVLKGLHISDEDNWNNFQLLDFFKREIILAALSKYLPTIEDATKKRQENWYYLNKLFEQDGFRAFNKIDEKISPGAYMVKMDNFQEAFERFEKFGVESGRYYPEKALFLPVHQNLDSNQLDYIYGSFRGMLNLSSSYSRGVKK